MTTKTLDVAADHESGIYRAMEIVRSGQADRVDITLSTTLHAYATQAGLFVQDGRPIAPAALVAHLKARA